MLHENPTFLSYLATAKEGKSPYPDAGVIESLVIAHPELLYFFRNPRKETVERTSGASLRLHGLAFESPFSSFNFIDAIHTQTNYVATTPSLANPKPGRFTRFEGHLDLFGASFLKPGSRYSADLIFSNPSLMLLADGASMIAKPAENNDFPQQIIELCTDSEGHFLPDVFWSTVLAHIIGKKDFNSPFTNKVTSLISKNKFFQKILPKKRTAAFREPKAAIELINRGFKSFYDIIFPINGDNRAYFPSGVIACLNPTTGQWASTGDVRVGHKTNRLPGTTVNDYRKVDRYDFALNSRDRAKKVEMARHRAPYIGNIQGLDDIHIESGVIPLIPMKNHTLQFMLWSDGEHLPHIDSNLRYHVDYKFRLETHLVSELLAKDALLYHALMLNAHRRYLNLVAKEEDRERRIGHPSTQLKKIRQLPPLRPDDASFMVATIHLTNYQIIQDGYPLHKFHLNHSSSTS